MASIPEPTSTGKPSQPPPETDANACEIGKLAQENGMEVFHPAIGIFNDLRERITMTGPFLKAALLDVRKVIKLVEIIKGNQHIYAAFVEEALQIFQRVDKAAEIVDRPIRPGTAAAIVVEGVLQNVIAIRKKVEQYAQLPPSEQVFCRDETEALVKDHTAELNRSLAVLTVHTISALASDHDWSKSISALSLVEKPGVTVRIEEPERFKSTQSEHSPEELLKRVVHQALQHASMAVGTKTESLNASDDSEPAEGGANPPVTADDPQTALSRQQSLTTHQEERLRKYRQALQEVFSPVGSKGPEDTLPDDGKPDSSLDPVGSGSKILITIYTQPCALSGDQALQYMYKLAGDLEDLDLVEQAVPILHIITMLSRRKIGDYAKEDGPDRISFARSLLHLSSILLSMARMDEALVVSEEALAIIKPMADQEPNHYNSHLARTLKLVAVCQWGVGEFNEAIQVSGRALNINRSLYEQHPKTFEADLAEALGDYSKYLSKDGRLEASLKAVEECLPMHRSLYRERPEVFEADLANTLCIYSARLSDVGRHSEALQAIEEGIKIRRSLHKARPATCKADLAWTLSNYSVRMSQAGRHDAALHAIEECLAIRRSLHNVRPEAFAADFAWALGGYSTLLGEAGRHEESLDAMRECLEIRRYLHNVRPAAVEGDLAWTLGIYSTKLSKAKRYEEAWKTMEECLSLRRLLHKARPERFKSDLAWTLGNLSILLCRNKKIGKALVAIEECLAIRRSQHELLPAAYEADLAWTLSNYSIPLGKAGRYQEALEAIEESLAIRQSLYSARPASSAVDLAWTLVHYSDLLSKRDRHREALKAIEEGLAMRRCLYEARPTAFEADMAWALLRYSLRLSDNWRHDDALKAIRDQSTYDIFLHHRLS
ncbi:unnamed protein product [Tilletia caries]|uniref:Anaphase-promoting complex subunit 5 domain-containing protein n=1 Tax=Tilletia caries TaxID=13290 RepID=A0ABN7IZV6_9BASI|nr:unnamed protein product [Tilletia caries]